MQRVAAFPWIVFICGSISFLFGFFIGSRPWLYCRFHPRIGNPPHDPYGFDSWAKEVRNDKSRLIEPEISWNRFIARQYVKAYYWLIFEFFLLLGIGALFTGWFRDFMIVGTLWIIGDTFGHIYVRLRARGIL